MGGKLESYHFAFGDTDYFIIVDLPDNNAAAAVSLTVGASGAIANRTTVLLTAAEVDEAVKKSPAYRPPGASLRAAGRVAATISSPLTDER